VPETKTIFANGAKSRVTWSGKEYEGAVRAELVKRLRLAVEMVKTQTQRNISQSSRGGRSKPGGFPHADTGRLRNSIFGEVDADSLEGIVGTPLQYGNWLEFGTAGGRVIRAPAGGVLSWIGKDGKRAYAKTVKIGPMAARPFLRPTMVQMQQKIATLFTKPFPDGKLKVS